MPLQTPPIRGILFDLWNTLCWSDFQPNPMQLIAEALGLADQRDWKRTIERGMMTRRLLGIREGLAALEEATGRRIGSAGARNDLVRQWNAACSATRLYDDAMRTIEAVRGRFRVGLLSNTQSFDIEFLRSRGIEALLDAVCLSCDEGRLKPDPEIFRIASRRLGLPPSEVVMVGDSAPDDVAGALGAGLAAVHLDRSGGAEPVPGALAAVRRLTEIPSLFP
jgi:HAD superfamily hydrolase (TIGR01549 family)